MEENVKKEWSKDVKILCYEGFWDDLLNVLWFNKELNWNVEPTYMIIWNKIVLDQEGNMPYVKIVVFKFLFVYVENNDKITI